MRISDWSSDVCSSDLTFELSADVHSSHRQVVELGFGLVVGEIRRHSPGWQPLHIAFRHARPPDIRWHRRLLGENLLFDAESNALLLDAGLLSQPLAPSEADPRSEEHTSELQSLMRISYAVFCLKKKTKKTITNNI